MYMPHTIKFLRELGFTFALDWDDELQVSYPPDLTPKRIAERLCGKYLEEAKRLIKAEAENKMCQFVGGPLNGKRHGHSYWCKPMIVADLKEWRIQAKQRWAVYVLWKDGRAVYVAMATSEAKGRKMGFDAARKTKHPMMRDPSEL